MNRMKRQERILGLLLGTAVGDSLGLPAEGLSRRRVLRRYGGRWRHRLFFRWGMISDDTEHTIFVAQALLHSGGDADRFARRLARSLRWWMLALPAGVGFGTLRAIIKLWMGFRPRSAGVFTAGNGPSMRVAPIGAVFADAPERLDEFVAASTRLTHTDPKALVGALAVASLVARTVRENGAPALDSVALEELRAIGEDDELWLKQIAELEAAHQSGESVADFAARLGLERGVTGFTHHTVPVALYAWWRHPGDFPGGLTALLDCGGDTDTAGAIYGALAGTTVGEAGIPEDWVEGIHDWPRGVPLLRRLAAALAQSIEDGSEPGKPAAKPTVPYFVPGVVPRNVFFLIVVLLHGFGRLVP